MNNSLLKDPASNTATMSHWDTGNLQHWDTAANQTGAQGN